MEKVLLGDMPLNRYRDVATILENDGDSAHVGHGKARHGIARSDDENLMRWRSVERIANESLPN